MLFCKVFTRIDEDFRSSTFCYCFVIDSLSVEIVATVEVAVPFTLPYVEWETFSAGPLIGVEALWVDYVHVQPLLSL